MSSLVARALLVVAFTSLTAPTARAAWPVNPFTSGVPVATGPTDAVWPQICSDGAGGAIIAWVDLRSANNDVYAQRLDVNGNPLWGANGVPVCTAPGVQTNVKVVSDGAGGAIVAWEDSRAVVSDPSDIYAQRLNASGAPQWAANGVVVCNATNHQSGIGLVADGLGGAQLAWTDGRTGNNQVYAQRLGASGTPAWTANGVCLALGTETQFYAKTCTDGSGGLWVVYATFNATGPARLQHLDATGALQFGTTGTAVCPASDTQVDWRIVQDGLGGVIVVFADGRDPGDLDWYAQRFGPTGVRLWPSGGVPVAVLPGVVDVLDICSDGAGGVIAAWSEGTPADLWMSRIGSAGTPQWGADGIAVCQQPGDQIPEAVLPDGVGGATVLWIDGREGGSALFGQRVNAQGNSLWGWQGLPVCRTNGGRYGTTALATSDGVLATWHDGRNAGSFDVYAQRIDRQGVLGDPAPSIAAVRDVPNDQGGRVKVSWRPSYLEGEGFAQIGSYWLWRSVPPSAAMAAVESGRATLVNDVAPARATSTMALSGRVFRTTTTGAQTYWWEYVAQQAAHGMANYSLVTDTEGDSVGASNPRTAFMVEALSALGPRWVSAPDSGYSVDNLVPAAPAPFTGLYAAGTARLFWSANTELDIAGYRLYRGVSLSFVPGPANLVASPTEPRYDDVSGSPYIYELTAVDTHGNESTVTTLVPTGTLDAPGAHAAIDFLAPLSPNPLRAAGTLRFGLARGGRASVALYDTQGRRVRTLVAGEQPAGEHTLRLDARDDAGRALAPGLYLVRMEAAGFEATERVVVVP